MRQQLLHICGPFGIHSYGLVIGIALIIFYLLVQRDWRFSKIAGLKEAFVDIIGLSVIAGLMGGRIAYMLYEQDQSFSLYGLISYWEGGLSILGSVIAIAIVVPLFLRYRNIPAVPALDVMATYAPLLQSISRFGCLIAGCCYGVPTAAWWGISYSSPDSFAPLNISLHPTQLYSALLLGGVFLFLYGYARYYYTRPGQVTLLYVMLQAIERFIVDFWRASRPLCGTYWGVQISSYQIIAMWLIFCSLALFCFVSYCYSEKQEL